MSSLNSPSRLSRASRFERLPGRSTQAFRQRLPSFPTRFTGFKDLEGASRSTLLDLAGATTGGVRVESTRPEFEARQAAAAAIPGISERPQPSGVQSFFNFIDRPRSAVVGFLSGLQGAERPGGLRPNVGEDRIGEESLVSTAFRRARQGLSGEEDWRVSDFGRIAEKKAAGTASGLERGWAATSGFVIDTILDPITYLSFGGTILGRRLGSEAVMGYTQRAMREGLEGANKTAMVREAVKMKATRPSLVARRMDELVERRIQDLKAVGKSDPKSDVLARQLEARRNGIQFKQTDDLDETLRKTQSFNWDDPDGAAYNLLDDYVREAAPEFAAHFFYIRGAGGLRRWAVRNFGEETGNAYFASLPRDIQGGVRWRLPFYRDKQGVAKAWGIPGIGAARLSEKSPFVRKVWEFTEKGRDLAREWVGWIPGKYLSGENGEMLWRAAVAATGRTRMAGDGTTYADYSAMNRLIRKTKIDERSMSELISRGHLEASNIYGEGVEKYGDVFKSAFRRMFYDEDELQRVGKLLDSGQKVSNAEFAAYTSASRWRMMLDDIGEEMVEVFKTVDDTVAFIKNYVPRMATEEEMLRKAGRFGIRKGSALPRYTKHRSAFAESWKITKEGDAVVAKWLPNEELNRLYASFYGPNGIYKDDPREFMGIYLAEVRASMIDQKLYNGIVDSGLIARLDKDALLKKRTLQEDIVRSRAVEAVGEVDSEGNIVNPGWLQGLKDKLEITYAPEGKTLSLTRAQQLEDYLARGSERFTVAGPIRANYDTYSPVPGQADVWQNRTDGTYIIRNSDNTYNLRSRTGELLRDEEGSIVTIQAEAAFRGQGDDVFKQRGFERAVDYANNYARDPMSATSTNARGRTLKAIRDEQYVNDITDFRAKLIADVDEFMAEYPYISLSWLSEDVLKTLPPDQHSDHIASIVRQLHKRLEFYGADAGEARMTATGAAMVERAALLEDEYVVPETFKRFIEASGYVDARLATPDGVAPRGRLPNIRNNIARQMELDFAPDAVMRSVRRMFEANQKPRTAASKIWEEVYKPFYAMQKSLMTVGRGPGFVARNLIGGSWNNWLNNVGRQDHLASGKIFFLQRRAKEEVKRNKGREFFDRNPESAASAVKEEFEKLVRRTYGKETGNFLDGVNDADALIELHELFFYQALGSERNMSRVAGELFQRGRDMGRGARNVEVPTLGPDGQMRTTTVVTGADTVVDGQSVPIDLINKEDISKWERGMNYLAYDNPWIRNVMSPLAESSEDYLRFAAFLKGAREMGLEAPESGVRGYAASLWVKATQFDYSDLNDFERGALKMVVPFYTWTRYNVPLQLRAIIHEPGKIQQALRIHESLAYVFGDENAGPTPSYILEKLGFEIPEERFAWLPKFLRPQGNVAIGMVHAEPLVDISRWIRTPANRYGERMPLNVREISQNLNPLLATLGTFSAGIEGDPSVQASRTQQAPGWTRVLPFVGFNDPETGEKQVSRYFTETVRNMLPMIGMAERYVPWLLGDERQPGRWFTTAISATVGLPVSTVDDWQRSSEQERNSRRIKQQMDLMFGDSSQYRMQMIRRLVQDGAPVEFFEHIELDKMEDTAVDVARGMAVWQMTKRIGTLLSMGVPIEEVATAMSAIIPEGTPADEWITQIWENLDVPDSDLNRYINQFDRQKLTKEDLAEFGLKPEDLNDLTNEQLRLLIAIKNREVSFEGPF